MRRPRLLVLLALVLCAGACRAPELGLPLAEPGSLVFDLDWDALTLGPNDVLYVAVDGHPDLVTPVESRLGGVRVDGAGAVVLPLAGAVHVAGLDLEGARAAITEAYAEYLVDPTVQVSVVEYGSRRFYVYGQVETPGAFPMDRPLNAYQALATAGGFTTGAFRREVVLMRQGEEGVEVHLVDAENPGETGLVALQPDDFLFVRRTGVGRFSEDVMPAVAGVATSLNAVAAMILIANELDE